MDMSESKFVFKNAAMYHEIVWAEFQGTLYSLFCFLFSSGRRTIGPFVHFPAANPVDQKMRVGPYKERLQEGRRFRHHAPKHARVSVNLLQYSFNRRDRNNTKSIVYSGRNLTPAP